jgi:pimeloyl-ACP methyl ester carboxylesterase
MRRRIFLAAAFLVVAVFSPATAQGAVAWGTCADAVEGSSAFQCGRIATPLDHTGAIPGAIDLFALRLVAQAPSTTAVVALAGGPGQAATPMARDFAISLAPALGTRDLIVVDQRGTGQSGPLRCGALSGRGTLRALVRRCADQIGPARGLFRTEDSAHDLEILRREAGYEKLTLYGVSYGTKVALAYAARYPDRVERLVLDSVVTPEGPDALQRSSLRATARILRALCAGSLCRRATPDPVADLRRLVARRTIRGSYVTDRGRKRRAVMDTGELFSILAAGDLNPAWRAQLPGAMRAAVRGDEAPLLRLGAAALSASGLQAARAGSQVPSSNSNEALYLATVCEDVTFPWNRAAGVEARLRDATAAINVTPIASLRPFDRRTAASNSLLPLCLGWPNAAPAPPAEPPLPQVPSLVINGMADVRTPAEDARVVASRLGAATVAVPYVGHSVVGNDGSGCAEAAIAAFFRDAAPAPCAAGSPALEPAPRPPLRVGAVRRAKGLAGLPGRTLGAVQLTRYDALVQWLGHALDGGRRAGGLRGGTITATKGGVRLRRVQYVPGVIVSGTMADDGPARLRISGPAAANGRLTFRQSGRVTGRLGGRRVNLKSARPAALQDRLPTLEELDRLPNQRRIG